MKNPGVVLRKLRERNNLKIKEAAKLIGRSVGWLSGVENEAQACRLKESEYQRILQSSTTPKITSGLSTPVSPKAESRTRTPSLSSTTVRF